MRFLAGVVLLVPAVVLAEEPPRVTPGEVIVIHERVAPAKPAKQLRPKRIPPPYTDEAILEDVDGRAWAILDISAEGRVTGVHFIRKAGHGLDELAAKEARGYRFQPAEDATGKRIPSRMLWLFEWPSYFRSRTLSVIQMSDPCERMASGGPLNLGSMHPVKRDCYVPTPAEIQAVVDKLP